MQIIWSTRKNVVTLHRKLMLEIMGALVRGYGHIERRLFALCPDLAIFQNQFQNVQIIDALLDIRLPS